MKTQYTDSQGNLLPQYRGAFECPCCGRDVYLVRSGRELVKFDYDRRGLSRVEHDCENNAVAVTAN